MTPAALTDAVVRALETHEGLLTGMGIFSLIVFAVTLIALPMIIAYLPRDYLSSPENLDPKQKSATEKRFTSRAGFMAYRIGKNALAVVLIIAGLALLLLPGQGLITLLIGISLLEFPGKRKVIRKLLTQNRVLKGANKLRKRMGRPPLETPG